MPRNRTRNLVVAIALVGIIGLAATAFADWGRGPGRWYGPGPCADAAAGYGQRGFGYPAAYDNLSDEQLDRLDRMRTEFFEDTRDLRDRMWEKRSALQSELAKQAPNEARAVELQKEVSELKNQMARKRLEQQLALQKEFPELAGGSRFGRGYGKGRGWGMRPGDPGRGYGMGPGYGRGGCRY